MRSIFNDAYAILFSVFLHKSVCCGYSFEATEISTQNMCFYKEADKSILAVI